VRLRAHRVDHRIGAAPGGGVANGLDDVRLFRRVDHRDFTRAGACEALGARRPSVGSWMTGSGTVSTGTSARPCQVTARFSELPRWGRDRPLGRPTCPFVTWIAGLSTRQRVAFTLSSPPITERRITFVKSCGTDHKTAGQYALAHITNRSRRVYMGPAPLPGSACGMPANGSQVHEFAPPGPPPRRGIGARHRVCFDPHNGPRNLAATR
jgi:hypothetical protein